jgi:hypothetical protein
MAWLATRSAISLAVFAAVSALAELFGAANLGTALTFGQIGFALTVTLLILKT